MTGTKLAKKVIVEFASLDRLFNRKLASVNEEVTCHYVFVIFRAIACRIEKSVVTCERFSQNHKCRVDMMLEMSGESLLIEVKAFRELLVG